MPPLSFFRLSLPFARLATVYQVFAEYDLLKSWNQVKESGKGKKEYAAGTPTYTVALSLRRPGGFFEKTAP